MMPNSAQDVMIGIMGPTGTGKSSFIRLATGNQKVEIGYSVESMTSEIGRYNCFTESGRCVTFVDTPGFDDSREGVTDTDILRKIASFLDVQFKDGKKLSGIIYLHRITDPRMGGISNRNLRMFKKLCGEDALKNVIVVTTRWDDIPDKDRPAMGVREEELMKTKGKFFEPLIAAGGGFLRHDNTAGSAHRIMEKFLDNDPIALQIQVEMRDGKKVEETAAGAELTAEMNRLIEKYTNEMKHLRKEMEEAIAEKDEALKKELEAERIKLRQEMEKWEAEKKRLAGDLESVRREAEVAQKESERKMGQQREEFLRKVQEAEEKAEKERKELKETMDRMETEKVDASRRLKDLETTKDSADKNNQELLAKIQVQIDQEKRDKERLAGDLESVRREAEVAQKESERKMGQQGEEFLRKVREVEEKAEKELKEAIDRMEKELKADASRRLEDLEKTKDLSDKNNRELLAKIQGQIDQAERDKAAADGKHEQLIKSMRSRVCHWAYTNGAFRSASFSDPPIECGVENNLSNFISRLGGSSNSWIFEGAQYTSYPQYEVLVGNMKDLIWISLSGAFKVSSLSYTPVPATTYAFVARLSHNGDSYPATVTEGHEASGEIGKSPVSNVVQASSYDVLCYRDL